MNYAVVTISGTKPTKKNPETKKVAAKDMLAFYLNNGLEKGEVVISVLASGFGSFIVVKRKDK